MRPVAAAARAWSPFVLGGLAIYVSAAQLELNGPPNDVLSNGLRRGGLRAAAWGPRGASWGLLHGLGAPWGAGGTPWPWEEALGRHGREEDEGFVV